MAWNAPYIFAQNNEVVIQHKGGGEFKHYLRINPQNHNHADPNGGTGEFARWMVELEDGGAKCKLKSAKSGKYLRIKPNASGNAEDKIDVEGVGGKWTVFKVHKQGQGNQVKLESNEQHGLYIAVQKDNKIRVGTGGPWCELHFFREHVEPFTLPYLFHHKNEVVIQHKGGAGGDKGHTKFFRVKPGHLDDVDPDGGKGEFAQWEADPSDNGTKCRFKSTKTGKYLRINESKEIDAKGVGGKWTVFKVHKEQDGTVKLESNEHHGLYLAVGPANKVRPGNGGPFTNLKIFRKQ